MLILEAYFLLQFGKQIVFFTQLTDCNLDWSFVHYWVKLEENDAFNKGCES